MQTDEDKNPEENIEPEEDTVVEDIQAQPENATLNGGNHDTEVQDKTPDHENENGEKPTSFVESAKKMIDLLTSEKKNLREENDQLKRNLANERDKFKRLEKMVEETKKFDGIRLAREILSTHENLKRAIKAGEESKSDNLAAWVEGIKVVQKELNSSLSRNNIEEIIPEVGDTFDHNSHNALYYAPVPGFEDGQITEVQQTGFKYHNRLLRPAQVGVAENYPMEEEQEQE
ncbi:MAG: nucleotide exchange factor GrpE [Rhodobacteraceae bacterium]|nr:nucleotide exchange factor GrpE [Paracoccaceae bacterium]MDE2738893.1 nucleotide exchange factor GrpE [Paracoccaceae bacterium]MYE36368.1 nucleotide exchange factor GrpE [Paracoccaceae bacterium]